jgi:uncharacterized repeat protein (TIGR02543 family)
MKNERKHKIAPLFPLLPLFIIHCSLFICFSCSNFFMEQILRPGDKKDTREGPDITYTVTFHSNGGSPVPSQSVPEGDKATRPADPTNDDGSYFVDWYSDEDLTILYDFDAPVDSDITLYAKWTENFFTVSFDSDGGIPQPPPQDRGEGGRAEEPNPAPEKTGYKFGGWFREEGLLTAWNFGSDTVTDNITLYAKWLKIFTVTFDTDGGSPVPEPQELAEGETADEPDDPERIFDVAAGLYEGTPSAFNYTFDGWYKDGNLYDFNTPITGDITLTGKWTAPANAPVLIPYNTVPANDVAAAVSYVNDNANTYTLLLDEDVDAVKQTLGAGNLTIIGIDAERTIQYYFNGEGTGSPFITVNNANASLTLGNNITLRGINASNYPLVNVTGGTLTMKTGSKITGHTNQENPSGAVYINGTNARFVMDGGEISGNKSINMSGDTTGGVNIRNGGTFVMSGGTIRNNTSHYSVENNPADIFIDTATTFKLSGNAVIGDITLLAMAGGVNSSITIDEEYTGYATLNLYGTGMYGTNIAEAIGLWENNVVITGSPTASDIGKFTLGKFICDTAAEDRNITGNTTEDVDNFYIGTTGADIGKLLKAPVPVTGITLGNDTLLLKKGETATLSATVTPGNTTTALTWTSNANSVATVNNGTVTAAGRGTATIRASADGASAECTVTVFEGEGIGTDPYQIWNEADLRRVGTGTAGWTLSAHYKLMEDIDLTGKPSWSPIGNNSTGNNSTRFTGNFDGNNKSIAGLNISATTGSCYGMFGYISGGVVNNLALSICAISGFDYVGGVAGVNRGTVENCYVTGNVSGNEAVGGVAGSNSGIVKSCFVTANVSGNGNDGNVGGVAGYNDMTVENCYVTGNVSGKTSVGGVVGYNDMTVGNCYATGNVSGTDNVGGVVGYNDEGTVRNCVGLNGQITVTGGLNLKDYGRVVGYVYGNPLSNNYARSDMTPPTGGNFTAGASATGKNGANITFTQWSNINWWSNAAPNGPAFNLTASGAWDFPADKYLPILRNIPADIQNPTATDGTTGVFVITVKDIPKDQAPTNIASGVTISRTGAGYDKTTTFTLSNDVIYQEIKWSIQGAGAYQYETIILAEGPSPNGKSCVVDATQVKYNTFGGHSVYLEIKIGGLWYTTNIEFTIIQ